MNFWLLPARKATWCLMVFLDSRFRCWKGILCITLLSGAVISQAGDKDASRPPRPRLQIFNGSEAPIDIFWLRTDKDRVSNGSVAPGKDVTIDTTAGHRFAVVDRKADSERVVTSEVAIQAFRYDPRSREGIPPFYTQLVRAEGFPIVASKNVNPYALKEAAYLVNMMLAKRPDVRTAMIRSGARLCVMAHDEFITDLPEFARMTRGHAPDPSMRDISAKAYWDARVRGTGGSQSDPFCTCAEENLLGYPGDPYAAECILIHEFAHNIHLRGLTNVDPTFDRRLEDAYRAAMKAGLWKGKYAGVNHHEYFAEGVQSWFDDNRQNDHDHNHVNTRAELVEYDPALAALCKEVFGETKLKYTKPATRLAGHLKGYDPQGAPRFKWPARLAQARQAIHKAALLRSRQGDKESQGGQ